MVFGLLYQHLLLIKVMRLITLLLLIFSLNIQAQFVGTAMSSGGDEPSPLLDSLIAYYSFEDASGNPVDAHNSYDLTASGTITYSQVGKVANCLGFATNGSLAGPTTAFDFPGTFSFSLWMKSTHTSISGLLTNTDGVNAGWDMDMGSTGTTYVNYRYGSGTVQLTVVSPDLNDGNWHHLATSTKFPSLHSLILSSTAL